MTALARSVRVTTAGVISDDAGIETAVLEKVPSRFNRNSSLTLEVKSGANEFDIPLDSRPETV